MTAPSSKSQNATARKARVRGWSSPRTARHSPAQEAALTDAASPIWTRCKCSIDWSESPTATRPRLRPSLFELRRARRRVPPSPFRGRRNSAFLADEAEGDEAEREESDDRA